MPLREALLLMCALSALAALSAVASDVHCRAQIGDRTIDGDLQVAAPCELRGTTVKGNVHLYSGGSLVATDVDIDGNLRAERADFIDVARSEIGGNLRLNEMVGDRSVVADSRIAGNIELNSNRSRLEVLGNGVGGNVRASSNSGGVLIVDNGIDGDLQCSRNTPPPSGGGNRAGGQKGKNDKNDDEGDRDESDGDDRDQKNQCASLRPEEVLPAGPASLPTDAGTAPATGVEPGAEAGPATGSPPVLLLEPSGGGGAGGWSTVLLLLSLLIVQRALGAGVVRRVGSRAG